MPLLDATFRDQNGHGDGQALSQFGPSIQVVVGHYQPPSDPGAIPSQTETAWALIDTGAGESCIDCELATKLGLPVIDTMTIAGANGQAQHDVYLAHISIIGLEFMQYGRFAGVHLANGNQAHGVLLGRTFLAGVIMIYDGLRSQITLSAARVG